MSPKLPLLALCLVAGVALCSFVPSDAQAQIRDKHNVTIYADANYRGKSMTVGPGNYDIEAITKRVGNDAVSSVSVPAGWKVILYRDARYKGPKVVLTRNTTFLTNFNDQASSMRVVRVQQPRPRIDVNKLRYEIDTDRPGQDIRGVDTPGIKSCATLCVANSSCRAITWYNGKCWLKRGVPGTGHVPGAVSAVVR